MDRLEAFATSAHKLVPAIIAVLFGGAIVVGFLRGAVSVEAFMGPAGLALGYYFRPQPAAANGHTPTPPGAEAPKP